MFVLFVILVAALLVWMYTLTDDSPLTDAITKVAGTVLVAGVWAIALLAVEGPTTAAQFTSGYVMEWVLSVDNLMAIALVFAYFKLPRAYEPRILSIGIASTIFFRLLFTLVGSSLLAAWGRPMEVIFGVLVGITAWKMITQEGEDNAEMVDHNSRWYIRGLQRWVRVTGDASQPVFFKKIRHFLPKDDETLYATPLLACLIAVEVTDIVFSFDSVPTVIAVSRTPLVIYSAMIFAIIGLRQTYFLLKETQRYLTKLPQAVMAILMFISLKMVLSGLLGLTVPAWATLTVVLGMLGWGVHLSAKEVRDAKLQQKRP